VFFGWWIVIGSALISWYGAGVWFYGSSVFFSSIIKEFGWSRALTSGAFSVSRLEGGLEAPLIGWLIDRFGPRKLMIGSAVVVGFGFILLSRVNSVGMFYAVYAGVMSIGYNSGFFHATSAAIANWFRDKLSRAFSYYALGAGVGGTTMMPLLGWLIEHYGWRTTAVMAGVGMWVIVTPMSLFLRHRPEQYGYLPDGVKSESELVEGEIGEDEGDFSTRQAMKTSAFWVLTLASACRSVGMTTIVLHQVLYLEIDVGLSTTLAATAVGLMTLMSLPGRLGFGWLGDIIDKRYVMIMCYGLQAVGVLLLSRVQSMSDVYIYVAVYGVGYGGAIPVYNAIIGDYYGRKAFATIRGYLMLFLLPATVAGPIFGGWIHDTYGSYQLAFRIIIILYVVGLFVWFFVRRPRPPVSIPSASSG